MIDQFARLYEDLARVKNLMDSPRTE